MNRVLKILGIFVLVIVIVIVAGTVAFIASDPLNIGPYIESSARTSEFLNNLPDNQVIPAGNALLACQNMPTIERVNACEDRVMERFTAEP